MKLVVYFNNKKHVQSVSKFFLPLSWHHHIRAEMYKLYVNYSVDADKAVFEI